VGVGWDSVESPRVLFLDTDLHGDAAEHAAESSKVNPRSAVIVRRVIAALLEHAAVPSALHIGMLLRRPSLSIGLVVYLAFSLCLYFFLYLNAAWRLLIHNSRISQRKTNRTQNFNLSRAH
jgi:hypothetical protein